MNKNTLIYEVQDLKKVVNQRIVLQVGRLQIHKGTIYGIVGPVGSGKSALLKHLSGVEKPTSGTLLYDEQEFKSSMFGKLRSPEEIKFVTLNNDLKNEKVSRFFNRSFGKKSEEIRKQYFNNGFRRFMWEQSMSSLSLGEVSWIKLIDAVESDPRVLIIDNYGSMMDDELENDITRRLRRMNRNQGTTIILSATDQNRIKRLVSVIIFLDKGHIAKIRSGSKNKGGRRRQKHPKNRRRYRD